VELSWGLLIDDLEGATLPFLEIVLPLTGFIVYQGGMEFWPRCGGNLEAYSEQSIDYSIDTTSEDAVLR